MSSGYSGAITIGQLQAFVRYIWQINDPLSQVSQLSAQVQAAFSAMRRIFTLLLREEDQGGKAEIAKDKIEGNVTFEHVQFGYDKELLMKDVNIDVKKGQTVAIVGPTGAGKTTLMNLLLRFYDVKGGSIKIDGVDIRDMKREDLRSCSRSYCRIHGCFPEVFMTISATEDRMQEKMRLSALRRWQMSITTSAHCPGIRFTDQ